MQGKIQAELVKPKCGVLSLMKSKNKVADKKGQRNQSLLKEVSPRKCAAGFLGIGQCPELPFHLEFQEQASVHSSLPMLQLDGYQCRVPPGTSHMGTRDVLPGFRNIRNPLRAGRRKHVLFNLVGGQLYQFLIGLFKELFLSNILRIGLYALMPCDWLSAHFLSQ